MEADFGGVRVRVAALDDIVNSKEWANRPKDRDALDELHALQMRQRQLGQARRDVDDERRRHPGQMAATAAELRRRYATPAPLARTCRYVRPLRRVGPSFGADIRCCRSVRLRLARWASVCVGGSGGGSRRGRTVRRLCALAGVGIEPSDDDQRMPSIRRLVAPPDLASTAEKQCDPGAPDDRGLRSTRSRQVARPPKPAWT